MPNLPLDHIEVASNILDAIAIPLRQFIDHAVSFHGDNAEYELISPIDKEPTTWVEHEPYSDYHFEMDNAKETFLALSNVFEIAHSALFADLFVREVGEQLKMMISERIAYYQDAKAQEKQEEYNREFRGDAA